MKFLQDMVGYLLDRNPKVAFSCKVAVIKLQRLLLSAKFKLLRPWEEFSAWTKSLTPIPHEPNISRPLLDEGGGVVGYIVMELPPTRKAKFLLRDFPPLGPENWEIGVRVPTVSDEDLEVQAIREYWRAGP